MKTKTVEIVSNPSVLFSAIQVQPSGANALAVSGSIFVNGVNHELASHVLDFAPSSAKQFVHCYVGRRKATGVVEWILDELTEGQRPYTSLPECEHTVLFLVFSFVAPAGVSNLADVEVQVQATREPPPPEVTEVADVQN